jgi:hypothetical protein
VSCLFFFARGFLRGEHSTRGLHKMRSNAGDLEQVVEEAGFS